MYWLRLHRHLSRENFLQVHVPAPATMNVGGGVQAGHNVVYATLTSNANCENNADGRTVSTASAITNGAGEFCALALSSLHYRLPDDLFPVGIYVAMLAENCPMGSNPRVAVQSIILQTAGAAGTAAATEMRSTRDAMYRRALGAAYSPSLAAPAQN